MAFYVSGERSPLAERRRHGTGRLDFAGMRRAGERPRRSTSRPGRSRSIHIPGTNVFFVAFDHVLGSAWGRSRRALYPIDDSAADERSKSRGRMELCLSFHFCGGSPPTHGPIEATERITRR